MKFICDKAVLVDAVTNVSRVIPAKSSIPSLEGIQIKASDNSLMLTGYDMESGITTTIDAKVEAEGSIVLSARLFADMIRKMPDSEVSVSVGERYLTEIKSGLAEFTILGTPADEFPELPEIEDGAGVSIAQPILKSMIDQTLFAIATTDTKPVHTGSNFDMHADTLTVVSVDGYRLAMRNTALKNGKDISFVVPGKVLSEIAKLLGDDDEKEASIMVSGRQIVFGIGHYSVVSRLLEGDFLDYKASIPSGGSTEVKISTRAFIECVERASLLISDRLRSPLRLNFDDGKIRISCSTSIGKVQDEINCDIQGPSVEMGFNNKYLLDALKAAGTDEVRVQISGALSPIKILPPQGDDFLFLVLPVRLKNDA
ncbi:MAG: DNA polymerase III subunit beta [Oscillospiraceae bacterium]|jgi:DNA polymerase-3 subunit beta|nr:DNA polymerase III subunit beta [Oscillospiraceae bacterium]